MVVLLPDQLFLAVHGLFNFADFVILILADLFEVVFILQHTTQFLLELVDELGLFHKHVLQIGLKSRILAQKLIHFASLVFDADMRHSQLVLKVLYAYLAKLQLFGHILPMSLLRYFMYRGQLILILELLVFTLQGFVFGIN